LEINGPDRDMMALASGTPHAPPLECARQANFIVGLRGAGVLHASYQRDSSMHIFFRIFSLDKIHDMPIDSKLIEIYRA